MTIETPDHHGVICLRNERTGAFINSIVGSQRRMHERARDPQPPLVFNEDKHLFGTALALSPQEAQQFVEDLLEAEGLVIGRDFVRTDSREGLLDPCPPWLRVTTHPAEEIHSPELLATMTEEVRAMWAAGSRETYTYDYVSPAG